MSNTPTQRDLDKALADSFPASDPVALHGDTQARRAGENPSDAAQTPPSTRRGEQSQQRANSAENEKTSSEGTNHPGEDTSGEVSPSNPPHTSEDGFN